MKKPIEDKTPLAAWATLSRDEAQMSVEEVVDALAERGHAVTAATIRGIEGGSKGASARLRRLMAEVYGVTPPGQKETGPSALGEAGLGELVQAVRDQTAAIERQTMALTSILATALGTQNEDARAAVEELVDRLVSPRRDADPVSSGTQ